MDRKEPRPGSSSSFSGYTNTLQLRFNVSRRAVCCIGRPKNTKNRGSTNISWHLTGLMTLPREFIACTTLLLSRRVGKRKHGRITGLNINQRLVKWRLFSLVSAPSRRLLPFARTNAIKKSYLPVSYHCLVIARSFKRVGLFLDRPSFFFF